MELGECKIFLSSSNRLRTQRDVVKKVVDELNEDMGKFLTARLALYRWENETRPKMGRPQQVIFEQSNYSSIDVYIGLVGRYLGDGTKEEFEEAYELYKKTGKPEIMMFQDVSPLKGNELDTQQIEKAQKFIDDFKEGGEHPGLITPFKNSRELEQRVRKALTQYVLKEKLGGYNKESPISLAFENRIKSAGVTNFYVSRDEWQQYRNPPRLVDYLMTAKKSVKIATYWLAQGSIEGVLGIYKKLLDRGITVEVVTIMPIDSIANTLAMDVNESPSTIKTYVSLALDKLVGLKKQLNPEVSELFSVCTSRVIPQAAVIFLDGETKDGRIQLEFRPYGLPRNDSFSMEVSCRENAKLYMILEKSWNKFFNDAELYEDNLSNGELNET